MILVDEKIKMVTVQMYIPDPDDRVWSLRNAYSQAFRAAGYGDLIKCKPHFAIIPFLLISKPLQLYRRVEDITTWRKDKNFGKENFDRFVREVAEQAKNTE